ncbi:MAG: redoxin domain-containing protein [Pirellulaceae bacterium]|nr:redoxin domain-containing protein [Pirellulaceae bacterium]
MSLLRSPVSFGMIAIAMAVAGSVADVGAATTESESRASTGKGVVDAKVPIGTQVTGFELKDFRGRTWSSQEFSPAPAVAVVFLGTECPLAKLYALRISQLEKEYAKSGVVFVAVNPNVQDSLEMMASFARKHDLEMPFLKDPAQELANAVGASRTPEVCLLDGQRHLVYRGRIDDQWGIGYQKDRPETTELKNAIDAVLANKPVHAPEVAAPGCLIGRRRPTESDGEVTYANQISRIVQKRCLECHRDGEIGPMDFTSYEDVVAWSDMMYEVISDRRMPPWHANPQYGHFVNDRSLSAEEIQLFEKWVDSGTPLGNVEQLPEPIAYVDGWQLPREPDLVIPVSSKPFKVPAKGAIQYQHFSYKTDLKEDKWIKAAEVRPGNRAVVHHVLVFDRPAGSEGGIMPHRSFLVGYVPGGRVAPFPDGMAKRLPAGSELIFQVHYTSIGTEQLDQSHMGLVFEDDPSKLTHEVQTTSVVDLLLQIPPGDGNYTSSAALPTPLPDCELLALNPHMHLRGKSYRYTATFPDGRKEILLDVPNYDFNWQTDYQFTERIKVPAGTKILGEAAFDNSDKNLNNPDSSKWVMFGDQTWDEMMIGYMHVAIPIDPATGRAKSSVLPRDLNEGFIDIEEIFARLDRNQDGKVSPAELPERIRPFSVLVDADRDGSISLDEFRKIEERIGGGRGGSRGGARGGNARRGAGFRSGGRPGEATKNASSQNNGDSASDSEDSSAD